MSRQIEKIRNCELITEGEVRRLCAKAYEILIEESNVQRVDAPVTVKFCQTHFLFLRFDAYALICLHVCLTKDMRRHTWTILRFDGAI